jgi:hypothetical protein
VATDIAIVRSGPRLARRGRFSHIRAAPVQLTAANVGSVPRVFVHTTRDNAVSCPLQKAMLANTGGASKLVEIESSHERTLSHPKALADAIANAAP